MFAVNMFEGPKSCKMFVSQLSLEYRVSAAELGKSREVGKSRQVGRRREILKLRLLAAGLGKSRQV